MTIDKNAITERLIKSAGISGDMRVLDVGCGQGEVSLLVADIVGANGEVVGIDLSNQAITKARLNASAQQVNNVVFKQVDIFNTLYDLGEFDVIIGRRVLM